MSDERRRSLGRGLSALLGEEAEPAAPAGVRTVPIARLHPGRFQPRRHFDEAALAALAASVAAQGVLQPLLVRRHPEHPDDFEILAGERRWRAAQRARLHEVPVLVREMSDRDALETAIVENIQREDLNPLEEAQGYQRLVAEFHYTQEALGERVGKSRSHVANMMRLLALPEEVKRLLADGSLSMGHARALLAATDPAALACDVVARGLNVRETERLAQAPSGRLADGAAARPDTARDPNVVALERDLATVLGLKVALSRTGAASGSLVIHYRTLDQLDAVLARLRGRG